MQSTNYLNLNGYAKYAWFVLVFNIGVILFGAFVRATGSGAGCGSHWPSCHGAVIPQPEHIETLIEFTHRATSGIALLLVAGMLIWAFRIYPKGHRVRFGASLSSFFIILEALVGASLVLFGWVADDDSMARAIVISIHLVNTLLLLAALTLAAWWASGGAWLSLRGRGILLWGLGIGAAGMLILGVTGAITALGDTLFPAGSITEVGRAASPTAHFLVRLRVWHPVTAIVVGFYLAFMSGILRLLHEDRLVRRLAIGLIALFVIQLAAGLINLILLAPVWMQMIHLLLADLVWIALVLTGAAALAETAEETAHASAQQPVASYEQS
jgi:heme A synthase